jgi:hypothetical protein
MIGGVHLTNGPLGQILRNRHYLGEINHRGRSWPGEHAAIVDAETFAQVQAKLDGQRVARATRLKSNALLLGKLFDEAGERLGRVDGFDEDDCKDECQERSKVDSSFLAPEGYPLEALDFADRDFDASSGGVEDFRKELWLIFDMGPVRDGRTHAAVARSLPIGLRVVSFVGERGARVDVWSDIQQSWELRTVGGFASGQQISDR